MRVQAGTALGEAAEVRWDTIPLYRGDMLLMVATSRYHGMPFLPFSKDGLHGALFNLWTPDAKDGHHQPNSTHLDPPSPSRPWPLLGICRARTALAWTGGSGWEQGHLGGWGCGSRMLPRPSSPTPPRRSYLPPPLAPTTPPSSPPSPDTDFAVMGVANHSVLSLVGLVHQIAMTKGDNVDAEHQVHFAISGVPPRCGSPRCSTWATSSSVGAPKVHARWGVVNRLPV